MSERNRARDEFPGNPGHQNLTKSHWSSRMLRVKIVCTIGPASTDPEILAQMIDAGMNVARINMSHAIMSFTPATSTRSARLRKCGTGL